MNEATKRTREKKRDQTTTSATEGDSIDRRLISSGCVCVCAGCGVLRESVLCIESSNVFCLSLSRALASKTIDIYSSILKLFARTNCFMDSLAAGSDLADERVWVCAHTAASGSNAIVCIRIFLIRNNKSKEKRDRFLPLWWRCYDSLLPVCSLMPPSSVFVPRCVIVDARVCESVCVRERLLIVARTPLQADRLYRNECTARCKVNTLRFSRRLTFARTWDGVAPVCVCARAFRCFRFFGRSWLDTGRSKRTVYIKPLRDWVIFYKHCAARFIFFFGVFPYFHRSGSVARREFLFFVSSLFVFVKY